MTLKKTKATLIALITLLVSLEFGCQNPNNSIPDNIQNAYYDAPIPKAAEFTGNITVTVPKTLDTSNLTLAPLSQNSIGPGMIYSRLMKINIDPTNPRSNLSVGCDLCSDWSYDENKLIHFTIRDDVYWHDGSKLSPGDIASHYLNLIQESSNETFNIPIQSIDENGPYKLTFTTKQTDSDFMMKLAHTKSKIFNPNLWHTHLNSSEPIADLTGTGAWMSVQEYPDSNDSITLIRNPVYFSHQKPLSQTISINYIDNLSIDKIKAITASGNTHFILNTTQYGHDTTGTPYQSITKSLSYGGPSLFFNMAKKSMQNLKKRQSIFLLLDPWQQNSKSGLTDTSVGIGIPQIFTDYSSNQIAIRKQHFDDPVSAQLNISDIDIEQQLKIGVMDSPHPYNHLLEQIITDLESSTFQIHESSLSPENYVSEITNKNSNFDILLGLTPPEEFINDYLLSTLHSSSDFSFSNTADTQLNEMIELQTVQTDELLRSRQLRDIQNHVLEQAYMYNSAPLQHEWIYHNSVRNFFPNDNLGEYLYWSEVWID